VCRRKSSERWRRKGPGVARKGPGSIFSKGCALSYRELFKQPLAAYDLKANRLHLHNDRASGYSKFQDEIETMLGRRATIVLQGRPKKRKNRDER
jgi:hypothetical protein